MKVLVVGAGGVGGYYGGVLSKSGEDVTLLARGEHLRAIQDRGLLLKSETSGSFTVSPRAVERPDGSWMADLALFCVKSYQNQKAIEAMAPAIGDETNILTLQNGIGAGTELGETFGSDKVLLGATYIDGWIESPGVVGEGGLSVRTVFGEETGVETDRTVRVLEMFNRAGIDAELSTDIFSALWSKLLLICGLSGMSCITQGSIQAVLETPVTRELTRRLLTEVKEVGTAKGVRFDEGIVDRSMALLHEERKAITSSMYLDMVAGKPLEIGVLNGAVSSAGKEVGIETPINDFVTACLTVVDGRGPNRPRI
jgi:2-dehydropantoate 2-reductase